MEIVRDFTGDTTVNRLQLSDRQLSGQLRLTKDLIKKYLKGRAFHEGTPGEARIGLGLSAEELAAIAVIGHFHERYRLPLAGFQEIIQELTWLLSTTFKPRFVTAAILDKGSGYDMRISADMAFHVDESVMSRVTAFNVTRLANMFEVAIAEEPVRLPYVGEAKLEPSQP